MEIQKSFSKTTFGGFKKEDVTQYIDAIMTQYNQEIALLKAAAEETAGEINELKTIIEEQYKKIVVLTQTNEGLTQENQALSGKNVALETELKPYVDANHSASFIIEVAKKEASEIALQMKQQTNQATQEAAAIAQQIKQQMHDATEQSQVILQETNEKANEILESAQSQAESLLQEAKAKKNEIIFLAKEQEAQMIADVSSQIEATIRLSEESEQRAEQLLLNAKQEAQTIMNHAKADAESEKHHYDGCLKVLEAQKSRLLLSLDEIKGTVQAIQITRQPKSEVEALQSLRQSTTEAIKKKFAMLNKEHQGGNSRD